MIINPETGVITLPEIDASIGPSLSRDVFLSTRAFQQASVCIRNEPWCSYDLSPIAQSETNLHLRLQFHDQGLVSISISHAAPRFGTSWADWSEEKELALKAFHESWLNQELHLSPGAYSWGEIQSCYDSKGGSSFINLSYRSTKLM